MGGGVVKVNNCSNIFTVLNFIILNIPNHTI